VATTVERPRRIVEFGPARAHIGPALTGGRMPVASVTLSIVVHLGLMIAMVIAVATAVRERPKPMMVQLVPAIAALGSPRGDATAPPELTPRPEPAAAPQAEPAPQALPPRPATRPTTPVVDTPAPPRPLPLPAAVLPSRERPRETLTLAEPSALPQRATTVAARPRFEQSVRELPALPAASVSTASNPLPSPLVAKAAPQAGVASAMPRALGRADGSPRGSGTVTAEGDFPYAWYIAAIQRKISEQWQEKALPGQQPIVVFEIGREGQVIIGQLAIDKSSGNTRYDRIALQAIEAAKPFPPLPAEYPHSLLRLNVSFAYLRAN
jgi:TonB family protein